jgi:hypothetical protein
MLFSRYDLLAGPRRAIGNIVRTPFRLLGLTIGETRKKKDAALQKARRATEITPVLETVDRFNRQVMESLSPVSDKAPLYKAIRDPDIALGPSDVESLVKSEQDKLESWLKERFDKMAKGLPRLKKWSIYSTSLIWGVLILALEATLGGGFSVIDALLDTAFAPLVTKGSAELFAYQEIRKITREMGQAYREALLSILKEQQTRYKRVLQGLRTSSENFARLDKIEKEITHPGLLDELMKS